MSRATDYLRSIGMPDETITKMQAELDQATAEADHLIDHAIRLHRGSIAEAALQGLAIRSHIEDKDESQMRALLSVLLTRSGQLASTVETLVKEREDLKAALAAAQGGEA